MATERFAFETKEFCCCCSVVVAVVVAAVVVVGGGGAGGVNVNTRNAGLPLPDSHC